MLYYLHRLPQELAPPSVKQLVQEFDLYYSQIKTNSKLKKKCSKTGADFTLKTVKAMQKEIRSLMPGQRYLFPGGWLAKPPGVGHAIIHAIEKQEGGKYTLMTFNTGAGLPSFHDYQVDSKGYHRYKPVVMQTDIEEADILNTSHS